jgi:hypothetical protein
LGSADAKNLQDYLAVKRFSFVTGIRTRPNSDVLLLTVPESKLGRIVTTKTTSRRQLHFLAKAIERDLGISVDFLISKGSVHEDMEAGLNALLKMRYPEVIQNCFTSFSGGDSLEVWLERDTASTQPPLDNLESVIQDYLKVFKVKLGGIRWVDSEEQLPSTAAILRELKTAAPALPVELVQSLKARDFQIPSVSWLESKLDSIRRRQYAIRREDGRYVLTEGGLNIVPHGKGPQGSDVARALALGRKKW